MEITQKIVLLGQFGVGKSSITRRFMDNIFGTDYLPTLGVQIKKKLMELPSGRLVSMIIWDLEGFSSLSKTRASYLLGSKGFVYVFDITRPYTYQYLAKDINYLKEKFPKVVLDIVGNKKDLADHRLIEEELTKKNITIDGFVSAKTGEGIQEIFLRLSNKLGL